MIPVSVSMRQVCCVGYLHTLCMGSLQFIQDSSFYFEANLHCYLLVDHQNNNNELVRACLKSFSSPRLFRPYFILFISNYSGFCLIINLFTLVHVSDTPTALDPRSLPSTRFDSSFLTRFQIVFYQRRSIYFAYVK